MSWFDHMMDKLEDVLEAGDPDRLWTDYLGASHDVYIAEEALREAEEKLAAARERALEGDLAPALKKEMRRGRHTLSVLDLLREVGGDHPDLVLALLPELYDCCLGINKTSIWGREILRVLGRTTDLHDALAPLVTKTLGDEDEREDLEAMNGLGMLLDDLGDTALLARWHEAVRTSRDPDVRELADAYEPDDETNEAEPPEEAARRG
ncbi:hypothetical protein [Streptomyces neyagawaensis]|uniref:Uncharacterized protein n=1 Tax=Streptomyces neyagawaensis TaxID=42238 RepID=A0ABV3B0T8_9ACTN